MKGVLLASLLLLLTASILNAQESQRKLIKELDKIEFEAGRLQEKVDNINNSIKSEEEAVMNLELQLQFKTQSMAIKKKQIHEKLRDLVICSTPERLNFLITTDDFEDIGRSEAVVSRMLKKDIQSYNALEEESKKIKDTKDFVNSEKARLEEDRESYAVYLEDLKKVRDKKKRLLDKVKSTKLGYKALVRRMEKGGKEISFFAGGGNKIQKAAPGRYQGLFQSLIAPLKGKVLNTFGKVWDSKIKNWYYNKGVTVQADYGSEVRSVADGTVSFSGWILGYGRVMIIKHKDSLFSVYAHLARSLFNAGDTVSKNSVLGLVGDSGSVEQSSLYFELRQDRNNIDPTPLFY